MTSLQRYAAIVCDLDGVVYRGSSAVEHAVATLTSLRIPVLYATNNASRTPDDVAAHLRSFGLEVASDQVVTSSQAAAWLLIRRREQGARVRKVLAVGGIGVRVALQDNGFQNASARDADIDAVVQGYGPNVSASDLAEAAYAIEGGAYWIATNTDATLPTERGIAPGNGTLVRAITAASRREPDAIAGKPHEALYVLALSRLGLSPEEVLAVGDRLDTDVAGAARVGMDSLLVLTGVHSRADATVAPASQTPTWMAPDLRVLLNTD